jgi:hypothetical protein
MYYIYKRWENKEDIIQRINDAKAKVKVKVTLVQALRLCTALTAHTRSRGIALLFHGQQH